MSPVPQAGPTITHAATPGATTASLPGPLVANHSFDEELRQLLRSRLILVQVLATAFVVLLVMMALLAPVDPSQPKQPPLPVPMALFLVLNLVGLLALWRVPGVSQRALRWWEFALFGVWAVNLGLFRFLTLAAVPEEGPVFIAGYWGAVSLFGVISVILAYGVLVPNTLRRSLVGVLALAAVPFVALAAAAAVNPVLGAGGHVAPLAVQAAFTLVFPAGIAVFAAVRADALQRRAFAAERRAERVGQYALKRKLGEGGMGEVWLAEHALLKRPCAVKFIRSDLAAHPATAARFEREVQAVTGLTHPNTVRVYDYGRADDGSFYYVMEYLDGPTLEELVKSNGPLPPGRVVYLLRQVCEALAEAHAVGLVHRDLKPGNIIVATIGGQSDTAKLLDFGLVQDLSADADIRLTRTGTVLGTPAYMSPEQAAGESAVDARGDVYGLGAVAFYALTGRPPFQGKTLGQLLSAHRSAPPPVAELRPGVPADLVTVVARCLAKDPSDRFPSVVDLGRAFSQCSCATEWSAEQAAGWWQATGSPIACPGRTRRCT
jgi:serine/threonine-protein kinase